MAYVTPSVTMGSLKNVSQFGPAVWPAIADKYTNISYFYRFLLPEKRALNSNPCVISSDPPYKDDVVDTVVFIQIILRVFPAVEMRK